MKNKKKFIKIAIDSPAAAGAGTLAKSISKHYKSFHNVSIDKNNIIIGPGSKELLFLLNLFIKKYFLILNLCMRQ